MYCVEDYCMKKIFTQKIEDFGKTILVEKRYKKIIKEHIGTKHGIYALYDKNGKLYYIGRALKISGRLKSHLFKNKHKGKWSRFSVYLTKEKEYNKSIEDVLISITKPKPPGNTNKPLRIEKLNRLISKNMKKIDKENRENISGKSRLNGRKNKLKIRNKKASKKNNTPSFKNPFGRDKVLKKTYKNKLYKAIWLKSGWIKYKNKIYSSPTGAAKMASGRSTINGKNFWRVQDNKGKWIQISKLGCLFY